MTFQFNSQSLGMCRSLLFMIFLCIIVIILLGNGAIMGGAVQPPPPSTFMNATDPNDFSSIFAAAAAAAGINDSPLEFNNSLGKGKQSALAAARSSATGDDRDDASQSPLSDKREQRRRERGRERRNEAVGDKARDDSDSSLSNNANNPDGNVLPLPNGANLGGPPNMWGGMMGKYTCLIL